MNKAKITLKSPNNIGFEKGDLFKVMSVEGRIVLLQSLTPHSHKKKELIIEYKY